MCLQLQGGKKINQRELLAPQKGIKRMVQVSNHILSAVAIVQEDKTIQIWIVVSWWHVR
jgi:hypothetical protein